VEITLVNILILLKRIAKILRNILGQKLREKMAPMERMVLMEKMASMEGTA
jgi:hypothetical protein